MKSARNFFGIGSAIAVYCTIAIVATGPARAQAPPPGIKIVETAKGKIWADHAGMTLYVFDRDPATGSASRCNGPCAENWPPSVAAGDAKPGGGFSPFQRDDGSYQWAYKGKPLYTWTKDQKTGDVTGEGVNNVWRVATP